jgi:hypothetical protein
VAGAVEGARRVSILHSSYPAHAGYPVRRGLSVLLRPLWGTGSPGRACHPAGQGPDRLAGDDGRGVGATTTEGNGASFQTAALSGKNTPPRSRGTMRPSFARQCRPMKSEGAGNAGCPMHPQPRVRFGVGVCTRVFTAEAPETSGIPHAMVLRLIRDLPGDRALLPPSSAGKTRDLDTSVGVSGPHGAAKRNIFCAASRRPIHDDQSWNTLEFTDIGCNQR